GAECPGAGRESTEHKGATARRTLRERCALLHDLLLCGISERAGDDSDRRRERSSTTASGVEPAARTRTAGRHRYHSYGVSRPSGSQNERTLIFSCLPVSGSNCDEAVLSSSAAMSQKAAKA